MSLKPTQSDMKALQRLYPAGREVEPEPGLDRTILALAEQAAKPARSHRPARWLGGLATAAALALVIAVVVDPGTNAPEGLPAEYLAPMPVAEPSPALSAPERFGERAEHSGQNLRRRQALADAPVISVEPTDSVGLMLLGEAEVMADEPFDALHKQAEAMDDAAVLEWIARLMDQEELDQAAELSRLLDKRQAGGEEP